MPPSGGAGGAPTERPAPDTDAGLRAAGAGGSADRRGCGPQRRRSSLPALLLEDQSMNRMNPKVDVFLSNAKKWQKEFAKLRTIVLDCGVTEELKWGQPCYTFEKKNIVLIHGFREYCALLFFKGALLKDAKGILIQQTENVQAGRQIRFTNVREIVKLEPVLKVYIFEAIEVERAGLKVKLKKTSDFKIPEEFQNKLDKIPALKAAFDALTPGRQRGYIFYFSQPKQSRTRESRVERYMQQILNGKGLDD
jgi:uncharacterized protein YdeI (YjbR/CyaY-like superfamily)